MWRATRLFLSASPRRSASSLKESWRRRRFWRHPTAANDPHVGRASPLPRLRRVSGCARGPLPLLRLPSPAVPPGTGRARGRPPRLRRFFAAIEKRDDPALRDEPVIVGG